MFSIFDKSFIKALFTIELAISAWCCQSLKADVIYVKAGAVNGDGTSWKKAYGNLDFALAKASLTPVPDQIWVAKGTYKPQNIHQDSYQGSEPNLKTFLMPSDVSIYGGFNGGETLLSQRNRDKFPTILSGDLNGDDINDANNLQTNKSDNTWHVLRADGATNVVLDSLIIVDGYAAGPDSGVLSSDGRNSLESINYNHTSGGAILIDHGAKVTISNSRLEYNGTDGRNATIVAPNRGPFQVTAALASGGGAIAVNGQGHNFSDDQQTLVTISSSSFKYNSAFNPGGSGGALSVRLEGSANISSSSFENNVAERNGGALHGKDAKLISISASSFKSNSTPFFIVGDESGGAIGAINTNLSINNSTFDSNVAGTTITLFGALATNGQGGAILFHAAFDDGEAYVFSVNNSKFVNNRAGAFGGGAISLNGITPNSGTNASISNASFSNNLGGVGGALYVDSMPTSLVNASFQNNQAWSNGGAVFSSSFGDQIFDVTDINQRALLKINNNTFTGNAVIGSPQGFLPVFLPFHLTAGNLGAAFGQPPSGIQYFLPGGGAVGAMMGGNVVISNSSFKNNTAYGNGGALLSGGSSGFSGTSNLGMNQASLIVSGSSFSGNTATSGGDDYAILDPANLDQGYTTCYPNGVQLIVNGQCILP